MILCLYYGSHDIILKQVQSDILARMTGPRVPIFLHSYVKLQSKYKIESS